jgi:hypothetical protein
MSTILPCPASSQMVIHLMSGDRLVLHGVNALAAKNGGTVPAIAEVVQIPTLPLGAGDNLGRVAGRP